jgi:hypothetical protein
VQASRCTIRGNSTAQTNCVSEKGLIEGNGNARRMEKEGKRIRSS